MTIFSGVPETVFDIIYALIIQNKRDLNESTYI